MSKTKPSPDNSQEFRANSGKDRLRSQVLGISIVALMTLLLAAIRYVFSLG